MVLESFDPTSSGHTHADFGFTPEIHGPQPQGSGDSSIAPAAPAEAPAVPAETAPTLPETAPAVPAETAPAAPAETAPAASGQTSEVSPPAFDSNSPSGNYGSGQSSDSEPVPQPSTERRPSSQPAFETISVALTAGQPRPATERPISTTERQSESPTTGSWSVPIVPAALQDEPRPGNSDSPRNRMDRNDPIDLDYGSVLSEHPASPNPMSATASGDSAPPNPANLRPITDPVQPVRELPPIRPASVSQEPLVNTPAQAQSGDERGRSPEPAIHTLPDVAIVGSVSAAGLTAAAGRVLNPGNARTESILPGFEVAEPASSIPPVVAVVRHGHASENPPQVRGTRNDGSIRSVVAPTGSGADSGSSTPLALPTGELPRSIRTVVSNAGDGDGSINGPAGAHNLAPILPPASVGSLIRGVSDIRSIVTSGGSGDGQALPAAHPLAPSQPENGITNSPQSAKDTNGLETGRPSPPALPPVVSPPGRPVGGAAHPIQAITNLMRSPIPENPRVAGESEPVGSGDPLQGRHNPGGASVSDRNSLAPTIESIVRGTVGQGLATGPGNELQTGSGTNGLPRPDESAVLPPVVRHSPVPVTPELITNSPQTPPKVVDLSAGLSLGVTMLAPAIPAGGPRPGARHDDKETTHPAGAGSVTLLPPGIRPVEASPGGQLAGGFASISNQLGTAAASWNQPAVSLPLNPLTQSLPRLLTPSLVPSASEMLASVLVGVSPAPIAPRRTNGDSAILPASSQNGSDPAPVSAIRHVTGETLARAAAIALNRPATTTSNEVVLPAILTPVPVPAPSTDLGNLVELPRPPRQSGTTSGIAEVLPVILTTNGTGSLMRRHIDSVPGGNNEPAPEGPLTQSPAPIARPSPTAAVAGCLTNLTQPPSDAVNQPLANFGKLLTEGSGAVALLQARQSVNIDVADSSTDPNHQAAPRIPSLSPRDSSPTSVLPPALPSIGSQIPDRFSGEHPPAHIDQETRRPVGGLSNLSQILSSCPSMDAGAVRPVSLNRSSIPALSEGSVGAIPVDSVKPGLKAAESPVSGASSLKSLTAGSDGRVSFPGVADTAKLLTGKSADANLSTIRLNSDQSGNSIKLSLTASESNRTVPADVAAVSARRVLLTALVSGTQFRLPGQEAGTVTGIKMEGAVPGPINMISGKAFSLGERVSAQNKIESSTAKVETANAGTRSNPFANATTFSAINGLPGSIKIDVAGVVRDSGVSLSAAKDFAGKIEPVVVGTRIDLVAGIRDSGTSLIQTIGLAGKSMSIDITTGIKADATTGNGTAGLTITTGGNVQPQGQAAKGDAAGQQGAVKADASGPIKGDATAGRPLDGTKAQLTDNNSGTVRGTTLTPQMIASISNAIRFGYPLPEGLTFHNGELAVRYGNDVLFFPGLKAALKFAEVVGLIEADGDESDDSEEQSKNSGNWANETRIQYAVKEGDDVYSIAASQLGDRRFADLIITINRSDILYRLVENNKVAFVYLGQILWLPSEQELNVYRKNFFGKSAKLGGTAFSGEVTAEDSQSFESGGARKALHDEFIATKAVRQPGRPRTTVRDLPQLQQPPDQKQLLGRYGVDLDADTVITNGTEVAARQQVADRHMTGPVMLHASIDGADFRDTVVTFKTEPQPEIERLLDVKRLAGDVRSIVSAFAHNPESIFVKLEMLVEENWTLVAAYELECDSAVRVRYGKNGVKASLVLDLPAHALKDMATEDFTRNWPVYRTNFYANKVNNGSADSAPPTPLNFTRAASKPHSEGAPISVNHLYQPHPQQTAS